MKAAAEYLRRLVGLGHRVAICEQVEDPRLAKGIVRREVTETITPGAAFADDLLDGARANYVCTVAAIHDASRSLSDRSRSGLGRNLQDVVQVGIAAADLSTGELRLFDVSAADAPAILARLAPREVVVSADTLPEVDALVRTMAQVLVTRRDVWEFDAQLAADALAHHFGVRNLEGFGLGPNDTVVIGAAGALLRYLRELQPAGLPHLARPTLERPGGLMPLDEMTRRNLELVESLRGDQAGAPSGTLLSVLDRTTTPMGHRLLRQWLLAPLLERTAIESRLDAVSALISDPVSRAALRTALNGVRDVERLASKAAAGRANPRELRALGDSLSRLPLVKAAVREILEHSDRTNGHGGLLAGVFEDWDDGADCAARLVTMLVERPPLTIGEENTIASGVDAELDELRALRDGGKDAIATIQQEERVRTGIASLKVGYNRVFGYFLEVSNANRHLVPDDYQRRQTLTGAERYVTAALKEYEEKVLNAAGRIEVRERDLFEAIRREAGEGIARWQLVARRIATVDVLTGYAEVAEHHQYVRPTLHDEFNLAICAGRHPVVERMMPREKFIPNDLQLTEDAHLIVLTGPNMAGKSTILRQIGLIQLMAQIGMYIPAREAMLPVVDRLFTRVGASDNLVRGQSTFMVEMSETSAILHTATRRSLVLLDEIGRGTSTYDGVSIAWSVSEHLHDAIGCKTVFATHYHELTQLAEELSGVRNFNVAVREAGDQVLFLHRLMPGGADRSYGIEVGRLAGLPAPVIARAREVLTLLEGEGEQMTERLTADGMQVPTSAMRRGPRLKHHVDVNQLGFFAEIVSSADGAVTCQAASSDPALTHLADAVAALEPEQMTPLQALTMLASLKESMKDAWTRPASTT